MDAPGVVPDFINCHACEAPIDLAGQQGFSNVECPKCGALSVVPLQFGNILLLNVLGIGGMGTVYRAVDLSLNRYVAIKIIRKKFAGDPKFIETFAREARAAASVNHPNVAQVYSFANHEGLYYLTMELLERGSLDDRITKLGKVSETDVLQIGAQVAAGLRAAQQRGLLHRDIKPGNILFNGEGIPKIVDFGLASAQQDVAGEKAADGGMVVWGTPYYIAPEKLRGLAEDFRSDLYSLGATLFHALAGRPPFDAKTASEVVAKHTTTPAHNLKTYNTTVHDVTANVIGRMIAKEPNDRFESYDALIHELQQAERQMQQAKTGPVIVTETGERVPITSIIITIAVVVIAIAAIVLLWVNRSKFGLVSDTPPPTPPKPVATATATNKTAAITPPVPISEEVDFNENEPWTQTWNLLLSDLAQVKYQAALEDSEKLKQQTRNLPLQRRWVAFMEGVTLVAAGRSAEAQPIFRSVSIGLVKPKLADKVTPTNLVGPLLGIMTEILTPDDLEAGLSKAPDWAAALSRFTIGLKQYETGNIEEAQKSLRQYEKLTVDKSQPWAYALQPLARRLADDIERIPAVLAGIDKAIDAGDLDAALKTIRDVRSKTRLAAYKAPLDEREARIAKAREEVQRKAEETRKQAEEARQAALAKAREAEQQARLNAEAEVKHVQSIDASTATPLANYDFKGASAKYEQLAPKPASAEGLAALNQRLAAMRWLMEFKLQLTADIRAKPYEATTLVTRKNMTMQGKLVRATETEFTFVLPYGEMQAEWRDFAPATLQKLGEFYAQAFAASEKPAIRARRYVAVAVFAKYYNLNFANDLKQATQLDPAIESEIEPIFGKTPSQ